MNLSDLKPPAGQKHKKQRIGQGMGSGRGKYSGRGAKGQKSMSGYSKMRGFEGGQMPLHRRLPKRGFTNIFRREYAIVNVGRLAELEGDTFDMARLVELGVVKKQGAGLKILGDGDLARKISVKAHLFSKSATEKIQKAGGTVELIAPKPVVEAPVRKAKPAAVVAPPPPPAARPEKAEKPAKAEKAVKAEKAEKTEAKAPPKKRAPKSE